MPGKDKYGITPEVERPTIEDMGRRRALSKIALGAGVLMTAGASQLVGATEAAPEGVVVVTAATGNIGGRVLDHLLNSSAHVRVIARDASRLPDSARSHVEVVKGSHSDFSVVDRAFKGADSVFWLCPPDPRAPSVMAAYVDFTRAACDAMSKHGVRRVVSISALGRGTPMAANAGYVTASLAMDDLIASTGVSLRALTMPSFMDNLLRQSEPIKHQGVFRSPIDGDRKLPSCAARDIASVAARLLIDRSWQGRSEVPVLGPEDLSFEDMARIMSDVLGKPVRFEQISFEAFRAGAIQRGMSEAMAQAATDMARAKNEGLDNAVKRTTENSTPTTFRQWCTEELKPAVT